MIPLRMNQGDRSEGRVYFLPHFVAHRLGFFEAEGVPVEFVWAEAGDHLAKSGQIPAVLAGEADLTVGGPMVTMRMQADGTARLVNFAALVRKNPWYLGSRTDAPFAWADLEGKTILDVGAITTASLSLAAALAEKGISANVVEPGGAETAALDAFAAGEGDYVFHSLHALAPYVAEGRIHIAADLAQVTGDVPWSAYITKPETLAAREAEFAAFVRAMARALDWVASTAPEDIVALVADDYPGYPAAGLLTAVRGYKDLGVWAETPVIEKADFERFRAMLMSVGWFDTPVPYEDQVPAAFTKAALAAEKG